MSEPPPILSTSRLTLTPPTTADAEALFAISSDSAVTEFLAWEPHDSVAQSKAVISSMQNAQATGQGWHWLIWQSKELVGVISLIDITLKQRSWSLFRAELAYWIDTKHQAKGYATEAAKPVIQFAFEHLGLKKIVVAHAEQNPASKRVIDKLGFTHYATERYAFEKSQTWHSLLWYDLLAEEFAGELDET
ncbi:GNAT family N-acetyltransferase [Neiella marina]|uniref:GNAT family N-acetyltransferase n=1 Tax=Neiella holothuriorum TaxID=2870530 RepID=A0ABS7EGJ7_9GAMM|nr:GNAT family N-acetyltransferase [Neiella holothuriorum]MBW8190822.1 GNAT family N-acetyltransferase [Neiella holothuriorum]